MSFADGQNPTALAKILGVSRAQVRLLVEKGIFKTDENKRISVSAAKQAYTKYQEGLSKKESSKSKAAAVKLLNAAAQDLPDDFKGVYQRWMNSVEADPIAVLNAAKAYLTALQAKTEKLKLDELEGRLYSIERINADAEKAGGLVRSKLITIPARVATLCEGRTARDIEEIITDEINKALEDMQCLFV